MEKNIIVVDEQGHEYGATYPKRAKGLVKNGRARFVDEHTICLACPPNEFLEETEMSENINITEDTNQNTENTNERVVASVYEKYSLGYALDMIERIATDTEHIYHALNTLACMPNEPTPTGGAAEQPAKAAAEIVRCRETTNQKLLEFYRQMVDDLKPRAAKAEGEDKVRQQFLNFVRDTTVAADAGSILPDFAKIWETVYNGK